MTVTTAHSAPVDSADYCRDMIARNDEDMALALAYAHAADRPRLEALFALQLEVRRIPGAVSEPPLGEIRLQWWRDALDEILAAPEIKGQRAAGKIRAHPVVEALHRSGAITPATRALAERAIDGQAPLIYKDPFDDHERVSDFAFDTEGSLIVAALDDTQNTDADAVAKAARAFALAKTGRHIAPALADEICNHARCLWRDAAPAISKLNSRDAGRVLILALTSGYLNRTPTAQWPLMKRITLLRSMISGRF